MTGKKNISATKLGTKDNPRPFLNILSKYKMKKGGTYTGWQCRSCELVVGIDLAAPASIRIPNERLVKFTCPHCNTENVRVWGEQSQLVY